MFLNPVAASDRTMSDNCGIRVMITAATASARDRAKAHSRRGHQVITGIERLYN